MFEPSPLEQPKVLLALALTDFVALMLNALREPQTGKQPMVTTKLPHTMGKLNTPMHLVKTCHHGVGWDKSKAKIIIQDDLRSGVLPAIAQELSPKSAWDSVCLHLLEFHGVECAQCRTNLNEMQKVHRKKFEDAEWVKETKAHNSQFGKTADANGLPLSHLSCAAKKLQEDMERGLHNTMKHKLFWRTQPECQSRCGVLSSNTTWKTKGWRKRKRGRSMKCSKGITGKHNRVMMPQVKSCIALQKKEQNDLTH